MRRVHPDHVLISAATGMIPPKTATQEDLAGVGYASTDDAAWLRAPRFEERIV